MNEHLVERIKRSEGYRDRLYKCPAGKLTIGYGHNIEDRGISKAVAELMLSEDIEEAEEGARTLPHYHSLNRVRQEVLVDMVFNMGLSKVRGFRNMFAAIGREDWQEAALQMLDSKWARQVGRRAEELSTLMVRGRYD